MNKNATYTIPMELLYDKARPDNRDRRNRMLKAKCCCDSKTGVWICPTEELFKQFAGEIGYAAAAPTPAPQAAKPKPVPLRLVPKPVEVAPPAPAAPPAVQVQAAVKTAVEVAAAAVPAKQTSSTVDALMSKRVLELPPSFIVVQEVKLQGDVKYLHSGEEASVEDQGGVKVSKTKVTTETVTRDPEEHKQAKFLSGQLRSSLRKLGSVLQSGVIVVPVAKEDELDATISDCRKQAVEWNAKAKFHYIRVSMLKSLITSDAESAARDIAFRLQETVREVTEAIASCDVDRIKSVVDNSKALARIVPAKEAKELTGALAQANNIRKYIKEAVEEKGREVEAVRKEIAQTMLGPLEAARMSFLELAVPVEMEAKIAADVGRFEELGGETAAPAQASEAAVNGNRFDM